jgi:hypothetical protein
MFQVGAWLKGRGATAEFMLEIAPALWVEAVTHGLDPCVVIAQSAKETAFGRFGRAVVPAAHNTCGLKILNPAGLADNDPFAHEMFSSWRVGARAHVQHLCAYLGRPAPEIELTARAKWVRNANRPILNVEELGGRWAPSPTYGSEIAAMVAEMAA